jgi:PAS domain S-box-containing protein
MSPDSYASVILKLVNNYNSCCCAFQHNGRDYESLLNAQDEYILSLSEQKMLYELKKPLLREIENHKAFWFFPVTVGDEDFVFGSIPFDKEDREQSSKSLQNLTQELIGTILSYAHAMEDNAYSNDRLELAVDCGRIALWEWDLETNTLTTNDKWAELLGYDPDVFTPEIPKWKELIHPDDYEITMEILQKHFSGETEEYISEHRLLAADGLYRWVYARGRVMERDASGAPLKMLGAHFDNTSQKSSIMELASREARLSMALEGAGDGMWDWNPQTNSVYFSKQYYRMLGYKPDEFPHSFDEWKKRVHPADFSRNEQALFEILEQQNDSFNLRFRMLDAEGCWRWLLSKGKVYEKDANGNPTRIVGTHTDIHETTEARECLEESENRYRALFDSMLNAFCLHEVVLNNDGEPVDYVFLDVNPAFERLMHKTRDEVIGKRVTEVFPELDRKWIQIYGNVALNGHPVRFDKDTKAVGRNFRIIAYSPAPFQFATVFEDCTDEWKYEVQQKQLIKKLERQNAELERYAYAVSHDLKSPLITIEGFLGQIEEQIQQRNFDYLESDIDRIRNAAVRMRDLLDDLLHVTRVGNGVERFDRVSMEEIRVRLEEQYLIRLEESGGVLKIETSLPDIFGNRVQIFEVFQNLVDNGIKFCNKESELQIKIGYNNQQQCFYIKDNGIGIPKHHRKRIFDLFERLSNKTSGTGIGLTLVKKIVESHGGKIWVYDSNDRGTEFRFLLPLYEKRDEVNEGDTIANSSSGR